MEGDQCVSDYKMQSCKVAPLDLIPCGKRSLKLEIQLQKENIGLLKCRIEMRQCTVSWLPASLACGNMGLPQKDHVPGLSSRSKEGVHSSIVPESCQKAVRCQ